MQATEIQHSNKITIDTSDELVTSSDPHHVSITSVYLNSVSDGVRVQRI
jgi:hypothetical protein